jgi:hypothetical protein
VDFSALANGSALRGQLAETPDASWVDAPVAESYDLELLDGRRLEVELVRRAKASAVRVRITERQNKRPPEGALALTEQLYVGYAKKAEALQDAYRVVIGAAIDNHLPGGNSALERWAGWMADAVLLIRTGKDSHLVLRLHESGDVDSLGVTDLLYASAEIFAGGVDQLVDDLADIADELELAEPDDLQRAGLLQSVIIPWLMREAAQARLDVARQQFYWGVQQTSGYIGNGPYSAITLSALARGLYTDRPNLHRAIRSAQPSVRSTNRQPESL